jgi:hypothetical protein
MAMRTGAIEFANGGKHSFAIRCDDSCCCSDANGKGHNEKLVFWHLCALALSVMADAETALFAESLAEATSAVLVRCCKCTILSGTYRFRKFINDSRILLFLEVTANITCAGIRVKPVYIPILLRFQRVHTLMQP